jgi:tRNA (mo5U34)-methyltransferase
VLETLVVGDGETEVFEPEGRYACMRNVYALPSTVTLIQWLKRAGFGRAELIDSTWTSTQEQRATEWMQWKSLSDFLDPGDPRKTLEGHPAPRRVVVIARI